MRGRKPTPTALKVVRGETRPSRLNKAQPQLPPRAPACPSWVPAEGKAEWRRVVPELDRVGMLARIDRAALAAYCSAWANLVRAEKEISDRGLLIEQDDGRLVKNPAVLVSKDAASQVRLFAAEFGMTPSSRSRLQVPDQSNPAAGGGARGASRFLS